MRIPKCTSYCVFSTLKVFLRLFLLQQFCRDPSVAWWRTKLYVYKHGAHETRYCIVFDVFLLDLPFLCYIRIIDAGTWYIVQSATRITQQHTRTVVCVRTSVLMIMHRHVRRGNCVTFLDARLKSEPMVFATGTGMARARAADWIALSKQRLVLVGCVARANTHAHQYII